MPRDISTSEFLRRTSCRKTRRVHVQPDRIDALCRFMRGDITNEGVDRHTLICIGSGYFELPPKPQGEPVIPFPGEQMELFA